MEILIVLAVISATIVGIIAGNLFFCIFATVAIVPVIVLGIAGEAPGMVAFGGLVLAVIWGARMWALHPPRKGRAVRRA